MRKFWESEKEMLLYKCKVWKIIVAKSCIWLFITIWTITCQAPLSMAFPRQDTEVGCHFLLQSIFLTQALNPGLQIQSFAIKTHKTLLKLLYSEFLWFIIGIKINQRNRCLEQSPGIFRRWSFLFTLLVTCYSLAGDVRQYGWSIANQGNSTRPWCPHWDSIAFGMIDWLSTGLISVSSLNTSPTTSSLPGCDPKSLP